MIYFVIARHLISFIVDFDHSSLGTALVELIIFSALYLSIVLSAVLGILLHLKDSNAVMEFAKSFAVLVVLSPVGVAAF
jgi:hypothetical protein